MRREFAEYDDIADLDRQLASVRSIADAFLAVAGSARPLDQEQRQLFADLGAHAAEGGISLGTLLAGVELAMRVAWIYTAEEARELRPPGLGVSALEELGLSLMTFVRDLTELMTQGYRSRLEGHERGAGATHVLREILRRRATDPRRLLGEAREAGLDPDLHYAVLVVAGATDSIAPAVISKSTAALAARLGRGALCVDLLEAQIPHSVVIVPSPPGPGSEVRDSGDPPLRHMQTVLIVLRPSEGIMRAAESYRGHRPLLAVARTLAGSGGVVTEADLAVYRLLTRLDAADRQSFLRSVIGPLMDMPGSRRDPLLRTMEMVETSGGYAGAADALHVHRKTVQYRHDRVEEITGLDLRRPADRFRLQLALYILRLSTETM